MLPWNLWTLMDHIAWAAAPILVGYEAIQYILHPWTGSDNAPGKLIGLAILVLLLAQASYGLLNLMLVVNNALVQHILGVTFIAGLGKMSDLAKGLAAGGEALWLVVIVLVFLIGLFGAVISWGFRVAELILMVALAPIAAVLSLTESFHGAWRWPVREFASAAFSQSMWALPVILTLATLAGKGVVALGPGAGVSQQAAVAFHLLMSVAVAGGFLRLTFQTQKWLKGLLSQQFGASQSSHGSWSWRRRAARRRWPQGRSLRRWPWRRRR